MSTKIYATTQNGQKPNTTQKVYRYIRKAVNPNTTEQQNNTDGNGNGSRFTRHQTNGDAHQFISDQCLLELEADKFSKMPIEMQEQILEQLMHTLSYTHVGDKQFRHQLDTLLDVMVQHA